MDELCPKCGSSVNPNQIYLIGKARRKVCCVLCGDSGEAPPLRAMAGLYLQYGIWDNLQRKKRG